MNDVEAAFVGAFAGRPGVLLLAGTGSMAWGSDGTRQVRTGGWGEGFGDEGSAYWIGRRALGLASQALDGGTPTPTSRSAAESSAGRPTHPGGSAGVVLRPGACPLRRRRAGPSGRCNWPGTVSLPPRPFCWKPPGCWPSTSAPPASSWAAPICRGVTRAACWAAARVLGALTTLLGSPQPPALPPLGGAVFHAAVRAGFDTGTPLARTGPHGPAAPSISRHLFFRSNHESHRPQYSGTISPVEAGGPDRSACPRPPRDAHPDRLRHLVLSGPERGRRAERGGRSGRWPCPAASGCTARSRTCQRERARTSWPSRAAANPPRRFRPPFAAATRGCTSRA